MQSIKRSTVFPLAKKHWTILINSLITSIICKWINCTWLRFLILQPVPWKIGVNQFNWRFFFFNIVDSLNEILFVCFLLHFFNDFMRFDGFFDGISFIRLDCVSWNGSPLCWQCVDGDGQTESWNGCCSWAGAYVVRKFGHLWLVVQYLVEWRIRQIFSVLWLSNGIFLYYISIQSVVNHFFSFHFTEKPFLIRFICFDLFCSKLNKFKINTKSGWKGMGSRPTVSSRSNSNGVWIRFRGRFTCSNTWCQYARRNNRPIWFDIVQQRWCHNSNGWTHDRQW